MGVNLNFDEFEMFFRTFHCDAVPYGEGRLKICLPVSGVLSTLR